MGDGAFARGPQWLSLQILSPQPNFTFIRIIDNIRHYYFLRRKQNTGNIFFYYL